MKPIDYILNTDIGYTPYEAWAMLNWNGILVPRYSINYNFMKGASIYNRYSTDIAEELCKFLSDGNQYTYRELMNHFNIPNEERKNFKVFIDDLVDKRTYKAISDKYNNLIKLKKVRDDNDLMR